MDNTDIRAEIMAAGLRHWQVAEHLGFSEAWLCRKLRHELPEDEKEKIRSAIKELSQNCGRK